jgi:hypothetical protein
MTSKYDVLTPFLTYFHKKSSRGATLPTPHPSAWFYCYFTDHPRLGEVRPSCGRQSGVAPVRIPTGFRSRAVESVGGGRFAAKPGLLLFLSWLLALHWSSQFSETGRLYSTVTHHTRNTLHVPGSLYLDLVGLSLLVRKWGLAIPHPVCEVPCSSLFI